MQPSDLIVHVASDSPEWIAPVVAASAAIVSAALTWLGTFINDGRKATREDRQRWDGHVREEASLLMAASQASIEAIEKYRGKGQTQEEYIESRRTYIQSTKEARQHYEQLSIIASDQVVKCAVAMYGLVLQYGVESYEPGVVSSRHNEHRSKLIQAVRKQVGLRPVDWTPPAKPK